MRSLIFRLMLAASLGVTGATHAQVISVVNPSFEDIAVPGGEFHVFDSPGWVRYDPDSVVNQSSNAVGALNPAGTAFFSGPVPHGNNVALIYLEQAARTTNPGSMVGLSQTLSSSLQVNTRYTLTAAVGNIASGTGLGASAGFGFADLSGFPGYRVELLAGGQVVAADNNSLSIGEGRFATSTVVLTVGSSHALAGQALGIRLINLNATGNVNERGREVDFDAVSLIASAVPEPGAWALMAAGLCLLLSVARRRT